MSYSNMKYTLIILALLLIGSACKENKQSIREIHVYFDLDSLLDEQVYTLADRGATVNKIVKMNGETESRSMEPDTTVWKEEFSVIRDFNLNRPFYVGLFQEHKEENIISYQSSDEDVAVKKFDMFYEDGELVRIESLLQESKYIYSNERKLTLEFQDGLLKFYQLDGEQKMILQDKEDYVVSGSISVQ
ncbi:MAG: hypothetical protein CMP48_17930 [Rickettsiales bacterium]|nr:hypothetical protein [Rickettsiales bacterium]